VCEGCNQKDKQEHVRNNNNNNNKYKCDKLDLLIFSLVTVLEPFKRKNYLIYPFYSELVRDSCLRSVVFLLFFLFGLNFFNNYCYI